MPTTYTPNASNDPATYTLPSDLDNATAESVNAALRALADKNAHAYQVFAQLLASNTFNGTQKIDTPAPTDHAIEVLGHGRWRPLLVAHTNISYLGEEAELRYYVNDPAGGGGAYYGAIVCNAVYSFGGIWQQQANAFGSTAILFRSTGFDFSYMPPGSADWSTWPQGSGEVYAKYVYALNEFRYINALTRTMYLTPAQARGGDFIDSGTGNLTISSGSYVWWRIQLPVGASITRVDIKHNQSISTPDRFELATRDAQFTAPSSAPTWTAVVGGAASVDTSTGYKVSSIVHTQLISASTELFLLWRPIDNGCTFCSAKVTWTDPGAGREY